MNSDQKFWLILAAICIVPILGFSGCTMHGNKMIAEMTHEGVHPIAAACSINVDVGEMCHIYVAKENSNGTNN